MYKNLNCQRQIIKGLRLTHYDGIAALTAWPLHRLALWMGSLLANLRKYFPASALIGLHTWLWANQSWVTLQHETHINQSAPELERSVLQGNFDQWVLQSVQVCLLTKMFLVIPPTTSSIAGTVRAATQRRL